MQGEFRIELEARICKAMISRLAILTKDGDHEEVARGTTATELHNNTQCSGSRFMGVYGPKNAKFCE
eukprot:88005-Lingulodinium_polyedra.AAC.1